MMSLCMLCRVPYRHYQDHRNERITSDGSTCTGECYLPAGRSAGREHHFQARGHSPSLYRPTPAKPVNNLFISSSLIQIFFIILDLFHMHAHRARVTVVRDRRTRTALKARANEDTLLRTHCCRHKCFPVCPRSNICCGHKFCVRDTKMFLILFRNILCPQQMFPSLRSPRNIMGNNVSATRCPC